MPCAVPKPPVAVAASRSRALALCLGVLVAWSGIVPPARAAAASSVTHYVYDLAGSGGTVTNRAALNGDVALRLEGSWARDDGGVTFRGNTSGTRSVAWADPGSGPTIDVAASAAVGAAAVFRWTPPSGGSCPGDSKNVLQIGPFASGQSQVKLQLGRCRNGVVKPQCRVVGASSPSGASPVTGTGSVNPGRWYRLECVKSPDGSGGATVSIRLTDLSAGTTKSTDASIPRTGRILSSKPLSVANKYPMPKASANTDQFVGQVRRVAICSGGTVSAARTCLESSAPG